MGRYERTKSERGFTLIEVVAVLMILGVVSATAVPKMQDLTEQASRRALDGALAAGLSTASLEYARLSLKKKGTVQSDELASGCRLHKPASDDFDYEFEAIDSKTIRVTAAWKRTTGRSGSVSGKWSLPH